MFITDLRSRSQVAERLDISTSCLSETEEMGIRCPLDLIQRYSDAFGIPASSIMFFAERVEAGGSYDRARSFVAGKMIGLMQFLEARANPAHTE